MAGRGWILSDEEAWHVAILAKRGIDAYRTVDRQEVPRSLIELVAAMIAACSGSGTAGGDVELIWPLTTGEAALRLGVSSRQVTALCKAKKLKAKRTDGGWLIDPVSVDRRIRNSGVGPVPHTAGYAIDERVARVGAPARVGRSAAELAEGSPVLGPDRRMAGGSEGAGGGGARVA